MRRVVIGLLLASLVLPAAVSAETPPISRRDGFLLLWNSIHRALQDNREPYFTDVPLGARGEQEITYAKYRGILDDDDPAFHPDEPLTRFDALLWLFRTRSVTENVEDSSLELVHSLAERYPLKDASGVSGLDMLQSAAGAVTEQDVLALMRQLDDQLAKEDHEVSLYGEKFHGKGTAFGETFDMHALTAAHRTFPHNTLVKVTNVRNGKSVTVRINDRGPYVDGRDMDLSVAAFTAIEDRSKGKFRATFQRLGDATLVRQCDDTDPRRAVRIAKGVHLTGGVPATLPLGKDLVFRSTRPFVLVSVRYPDGNVTDLLDWVLPGESHPFTPSVEGEYVFTLGSKDGRRREVRMKVAAC